jgi:hypothetical protein
VSIIIDLRFWSRPLLNSFGFNPAEVTKMSHIIAENMKKRQRALEICCEYLCLIALVGALNIYIASLPGIGIGVWPQSELAASALHFFGGLASLGLIVISLTRSIVARFLMHPGVILPLMVGLISLIFLPFHDLPVRHLLGTVLTGEGVIWWLDWAVLSWACILVCQIPAYRKFLAVTGLLSMTVVYGMSISHEHTGHPYTPLFYPDFLGIVLLSAIPMLTVLVRPENFKLNLWIALYVVLNILIFQTNNHAAMLFSIVGFAVFLFLFQTKLQEQTKARLYLFGIVAVPLLIIVLLCSFSWLPLHQGYYGFLDQGALITVVSRAYLTDVVTGQLWANPLAVFTGLGWGTYEEHLASNLPIEWLDFTKIGHEQWDGLFQDHFHSHNIFIEAFYAGGILLFLCIFLYFLSFYIFAKSKYKKQSLVYCSSIVFLGSFWFFMPLNVGFIIVGACLLFSRSSSLFKSEFSHKRHVVFSILILCLCLQSYGVFVTFDTARMVHRYYPQAYAIDTAQHDCKMEYRDHGAGGMHLAKLLVSRLRYINSEAERVIDEPDKADEIQAGIRDEIQRINHLFCQSQSYIIENNSGIRLRIARLLVRGEILLAHGTYIDGATQQYYLDGWSEELSDWLKLYPSRSDQAIPYLLWHFNQGQEQAVSQIAQTILARNNRDPVGLWFYGLFLTADPQTAQQGVMMMRDALARGIDRFMPIDEDLKKQVLGL